MDASDIVERLGMQPHPEGGMYAETWRAPAAAGERPVGTAIYFLLRVDERSHWHRVDATEIWHYYSGDPLELETSQDGRSSERRVLGPDLGAGEQPQLIVSPGEWQAARSLGEWTLVGCTVSPAFEFAGFELAAEGWAPMGA